MLRAVSSDRVLPGFSSFPPRSLRHRRRPHIQPRWKEKRPRFNEQILSTEILLITEDGKPVRMPTAEALMMARARELDLIEVSGKTNPPVVKIGDYGHYLYQVQKKERKQRTRSKQTEVKTLRCGFKTEQHDLDRLLRRAEEFFEERHLVKLVLRLRGRELSNPGYAREKLMGLVRSLEGRAEVEQELKRQGNQFIVVLRSKR